MSKSWRADSGNQRWRNYKQQKNRKKEKSWNTKNRAHYEDQKYSPFDDSQEYHESF